VQEYFDNSNKYDLFETNDFFEKLNDDLDSESGNGLAAPLPKKL